MEKLRKTTGRPGILSIALLHTSLTPYPYTLVDSFLVCADPTTTTTRRRLRCRGAVDRRGRGDSWADKRQGETDCRVPQQQTGPERSHPREALDHLGRLETKSLAAGGRDPMPFCAFCAFCRAKLLLHLPRPWTLPSPKAPSLFLVSRLHIERALLSLSIVARDGPTTTPQHAADSPIPYTP